MVKTNFSKEKEWSFLSYKESRSALGSSTCRKTCSGAQARSRGGARWSQGGLRPGAGYDWLPGLSLRLRSAPPARPACSRSGVCGLWRVRASAARKPAGRRDRLVGRALGPATPPRKRGRRCSPVLQPAEAAEGDRGAPRLRAPPPMAAMMERK